MVAVDFGYSIESNPYFYDPSNDIAPFDGDVHSCSTKIYMDGINGHLRKNRFTFVFEKYNYLDLDTNGMSGGLIIGVVDGIARPLGMHFLGDPTSKYINFLPIAELFRAIKRRNELEKIGCKTDISENSIKSLEFFEPENDISIATYNDHRMAMAFAPLALKVPIIIENAEVVSKSYPDFWEDMRKLDISVTEINS